MATITFLIGAGASCNSIPLAKELPTEFAKRSLDFKKMVNKNNFIKDNRERELWSRLSMKCDFYIQEFSKHGSIDTYAKKLWLNGNITELQELKGVIAVLFMDRQKQNPPNARYDKFWASILEKDTSGISFPTNVNILTWNYDIQFKLSLTPYFSNHSTRRNFPYLIPKKSIPEGTFFIYPLNGLATPNEIDSEEGDWSDQDFYHRFESMRQEDCKHLVDIYDSTVSGNMGIKFAWENPESPELQFVCDRIENSEILVIIGYSFPFFNRKIDSKIFSSLTRLQKIYYQVKEPNIDLLYSRFKKVSNLLSSHSRSSANAIEAITNYTEFHLPDEL